jgi:hypothetical protein
MTEFAIYRLMLSYQWELGCIVIKGQAFHVNLPPGGIVAIQAVNFKTGPMW